MTLLRLQPQKRDTVMDVGHGSKDTRPSGGAAGCIECGGTVDRLRDPVRIEGSRVVHVCRACVDGREACEEQEVVPAWPDEEYGRRDALRWRRYTAFGGLVGALVLVTWQVQPYGPARTASAGSLSSTGLAQAQDMAAGEGRGPGDEGVSAPHVDGEDQAALIGEGLAEPPGELEDPEDIEIPTELPPTVEDALENSEEPLEERLPTLADWVFPVQGSDEAFPLRMTRRFGAERANVRRTECGDGHCGVDLGGPRGTPIVAVAWGVVTRIERRSDRRSGKYVRIEHPDYVYTSYMHLDDIAEGLAVGDEIQAGEPVGTLGRTGILHSAPHLHFSLEVPGSGRLQHIDPAPYLERAARLSAED